MRFVPAPDAIAPIVAIEHGTMIIPACLLDPDDGFAARLSSRQVRIRRDSAGRPSQSLTFDGWCTSLRLIPVSTCATVTAVSDTIRLIFSTTPLAASNCSVRCAYIAPDAPVMAKVNSIG